MVSRRIVMVVVTAALGLTIGAGPAAAANPNRPTPAPSPGPIGERPLTPAEQALSDAKVAAAEAFVARLRASGFGLVSLSCVPNVAPYGAPASASLKADKAPTASASCAPPSGFLAVEARQQKLDHYCGPAVGQVIANYAWAKKAGTDKHSQDVIAGWMKTNLYGQTSAPELAAGLQKATTGGVRHKSGFSWGITNLVDTDGDGTTADQLHGYLMSAISGARMPIALAVKPHEPGATHALASWPDPIRSSGHWIAAYGWYGLFSGGPWARTYYADSSGAQGGGTGKYWDPTLEIAAMIGQHTGRIVW
jgi:hypothetical protein